MSQDERGVSADERVRRGVGRTLGNLFSVLLVLALLGAWASLGFYTIEAGQQGVVLRFGRYVRTEARDGLHFHLPGPRCNSV